jgi:hypothetical protein
VNHLLREAGGNDQHGHGYDRDDAYQRGHADDPYGRENEGGCVHDDVRVRYYVHICVRGRGPLNEHALERGNMGAVISQVLF